MIKPIFDKDVDFFSKKIILCAKGGDFKIAMHKDWSLQCHFLVLKSGPPFLTVVERGSFSNLHYD